MTRFATLLLLLLAAPVLAQTPGTCALGTAERNLDVSRVYAKLFNTGSLFYGGSTTNGTGYLVPIQSGHSPLFIAALWVGGYIGDDLRVAGAWYDDFEFWPGPLNDGATLPNPDDCSAYDRIWLISAEDVAHYEETSQATDDLAEWPVGLGAEAVDASGEPVVPTSRDQVVHLEAGERPVVFGSQTSFWVMNDVGDEHEQYGTAPIGLEVQVTAFAVTSDEVALDRATFYRYRLVNRNAQSFEDAYFGFYMDTDLGDPSDDYVGVDTTRSLAFTYNDERVDAVYGVPPAFGVDLLDSLATFNVPRNEPSEPVSDPGDGISMYNRLSGLWNDGTPITEGCGGYQSDGPPTSIFYPGDPVTYEFWSEENDCQGHPNPSGDRRSISASSAFTLAPGEVRDFHLALVFGQGTDWLDSITELRAASDLVQAAYDDGSLFDTVLPDPPVVLAAPALIAPADEATLVDVPPRLEWSAVAGAVYYRIEISRDTDFADREVFFTTEPRLEISPQQFLGNEITTYRWRVRAGDEADGISPSSEARSFTFYRYVFDDFGSGVGIVEISNPDTPPCPDADDPGCDRYDGNTVWLDPNSTSDFAVTNPDNDLRDLLRDADTIDGDNFEMRFTADCTPAGACLGIYASAAPGGTDLITSVPFELWNVGAKEDEDEDEAVRMIPILRAPTDQEPISNWADSYTATQEVIAGEDTLNLGVTHRMLWMMPDREDSYARFETAATIFGGPGGTYIPEADGDTQVDLYTNPNTGETSSCRSQGYYIDFCYRNGHNRLVAPIGGLDGIQLADLAGDGTTPPAGTVIRFDANERLLTDAEDDAPVQPTSFALGAAYPNPFRSSATVPFEVEQPGRVRLSVVDVLGREVSVLEDDDLAAGTHRATLDGSRLASGVYLVVLEAEGRRQATKVLLLR